MGRVPGHPVSIGRDRILRRLGAGGTGVVDAAFDEREIAVKTMTLGAGGPAALGWFLGRELGCYTPASDAPHLRHAKAFRP